MRRSRTRVISNRRWRGRFALALLAALPLAALATSAAAAKGDNEAKEQLAFGVDMARRGLWNEALFRFEQLRKLLPDDPKVLNNLAVSYEAVGRFDDAEATYGEALRVAPSHRDIKKNVTRFREFLSSYRARKPATEPAPSTAAPPAESRPEDGR